MTIDRQTDRNLSAWYPIERIAAVAAIEGIHVRGDWRADGGVYGLSLPRELRDAIDRIDWTRVSASEVPDAAR